MRAIRQGEIGEIEGVAEEAKAHLRGMACFPPASRDGA